ncbi:Hpt domain protein [Sulfitobacter sp. THAF37]|uniref:Hpt domain-containing protein n=1 Tax=Sulfitobacter sp. THAF37 TaxID=2587855 RepID=UPI0012A7D3A9|nr:Hpt domain-containing protein [Sulfitobacter sp. THAF37]QFT59064.1 Hpt domain protein [Sulfitobacter sp. THAF37]
MKDMVEELPGLAKVRARFLEMLADRQARIAEHALKAWDGETLEEINGNLEAAKAILHQISGTAGSLGFTDLGEAARASEAEVIAHLEGPDADLAICPGEIVHHMDLFVKHCEDTLREFG